MCSDFFVQVSQVIKIILDIFLIFGFVWCKSGVKFNEFRIMF